MTFTTTVTQPMPTVSNDLHKKFRNVYPGDSAIEPYCGRIFLGSVIRQLNCCSVPG